MSSKLLLSYYYCKYIIFTSVRLYYLNFNFGFKELILKFFRLSVPETWCMFTNNNIKRSQAERATSKHLRNEIDTVLNTCCNDMWHQWNSTNQALTDRIKETIDARNKLQTHLSKVCFFLSFLYPFILMDRQTSVGNTCISIDGKYDLNIF